MHKTETKRKLKRKHYRKNNEAEKKAKIKKACDTVIASNNNRCRPPVHTSIRAACMYFFGDKSLLCMNSFDE